MYSDFLFLCNPVLIGYIFLRIYLSLLGHPICWHTGVHSSLIILISWTSVVMFPLLFLILIIWVFSFFLNLAKDLSTLMFKKETLFHWFFFFPLVFLVSILFIPVLIFIIFFLLLDLGLVSSLVSWGIMSLYSSFVWIRTLKQGLYSVCGIFLKSL